MLYYVSNFKFVLTCGKLVACFLVAVETVQSQTEAANQAALSDNQAALHDDQAVVNDKQPALDGDQAALDDSGTEIAQVEESSSAVVHTEEARLPENEETTKSGQTGKQIKWDSFR